jgi:hypothetical protein
MIFRPKKKSGRNTIVVGLKKKEGGNLCGSFSGWLLW